MATNGNVLVTWPSVPGRTYRAQYSDDLGTTNWSTYGVALAAIQGLNEKVESGNRKAETQMEALKAEKDARIRELEARLEKIERMMEAKGTSR